MAKLKTGDRVIYAFNDQRYNALVANVVEGFNRGTGVTGTHITLAYIQQGLKLPTVVTGVTELTEGKKVGFLLEPERIRGFGEAVYEELIAKHEGDSDIGQTQVARLLELLHEPAVREFIKDRSNQSLMLEAVGDGPSDPEPDDAPGAYETEQYADGSSASGPGPLPNLSPEQQDALSGSGAFYIKDGQRHPCPKHGEATHCRDCDKEMIMTGVGVPTCEECLNKGLAEGHYFRGTGTPFPTAADLDAHADEQKAKAATEPSEPDPILLASSGTIQPEPGSSPVQHGMAEDTNTSASRAKDGQETEDELAHKLPNFMGISGNSR